MEPSNVLNLEVCFKINLWMVLNVVTFNKCCTNKSGFVLSRE